MDRDQPYCAKILSQDSEKIMQLSVRRNHQTKIKLLSYNSLISLFLKSYGLLVSYFSALYTEESQKITF